MIPHWLHLVSIFTLVLGFAAAGVIMIDEMRHPQHMWIMNIVWPVVALFGTVLTVWAYFRYGRLVIMEAAMNAKSGGREPSGKSVTPFPVMVGKARSIAAAAAHSAIFAPSGWPPPSPQSPCGSVGTGFSARRSSPSGCSTLSSLSRLASRFNILRSCDAPFKDDGGSPGGAEGGCAIADGLADRNVWLHGLRESLLFPARIRRQT